MQVLGTTVNTPALLMLHGSSVGRMQGLVTSVAERYVYGSYVYSGGGAVQVKASLFSVYLWCVRRQWAVARRAYCPLCCIRQFIETTASVYTLL